MSLSKQEQLDKLQDALRKDINSKAAERQALICSRAMTKEHQQ